MDRKQRLFEAIVHLRRAERRSTPDQDVVAVRTMLEEELGPAISRRLAARLLEVDHKALDRWVHSGDLPLVQTVAGRMEVPVANVLELYEAVEQSRAQGIRRRHHLEPALKAGRRQAEELRPRQLIESVDNDGHARAERRSLAYHRVLALRLRRPMVDEALRVVWKWRAQGRLDPRYADQWEEVLRGPLTDVRRILVEDSQRGRDLRQNSPLPGC